MLVSTENHDLIEEFKKADEEFGKAVASLKAYMSSGSVESSKVSELTELMSEASDKVMNLRAQLDAVRIDL